MDVIRMWKGDLKLHNEKLETIQDFWINMVYFQDILRHITIDQRFL